MSPVRSTDVGSPTMQKSGASPRWRNASTTTTVPSTAGPSSSLVSRKAMPSGESGFVERNSSAATTIAASEVFMSAAPRPYRRPSRWAGVNGWLRHWSSGPVGTTSVWPANAMVLVAFCGRPVLGPVRFAHKFRTRWPAGPLSISSQANPRGRRRSTISSMQPASSGVTEGREIRCSARRRVADMGIGRVGAAFDRRVQAGAGPAGALSDGWTSSVISVNRASSEAISSVSPAVAREKSFCSRHIRLVGESA